MTLDSSLIARLQLVNEDIKNGGIHRIDGFSKPLLTGYAYTQFYDWDLYFENVYLSYYGISEYCFNNYEAFFSKQREDGFIARSFGPYPWGKHHHFKPFIAQNILLGLRQDPRMDWLELHFEALEKYMIHWFSYDLRGTHLSYWFGGADHSGCDNQKTRCIGKSEGVDLNAYLVKECRAMATLCKLLNKADREAFYLEKAALISQAINTHLWDESTGLYFDIDAETGEHTKVKAVSCLTPLWSGSASPEQAHRLVTEHLLNPKEFWGTYPIPTYAMDCEDYYVGVAKTECNWKGNMWVPTNYMMFQGLRDYGFHEVAQDIADKTYECCLDKNSCCREFYNSESGEGLGLNPFWGWSVLGYLMPLELETGHQPTHDDKTPSPLLKESFGLDF